MKRDMKMLIDQFTQPLNSHSRRVAACSSIMAECADSSIHLLYMDADMDLTYLSYLGGLCHDIGKMLLPVTETDEEEYFRHPVIGAEYLEKNRRALFDNVIQARIVINTVHHHHERPDGGGFPDGMFSKGVSLPAAICNIADTLDYYFTNENRTGGDTAGMEAAISGRAGSVFCESAVICFERAWPRLKKKYAKWNYRNRARERKSGTDPGAA
jgi:HD-GYP domain-containing protein (c-di-GMP phosphodiesterase class II)